MQHFNSFFEDRRLSWMLLFMAAGVAFTDDYRAQIIALGAIYAIALMGIDLVIGYAGMITIGHAAVFGVGAYAAASLSWQFGVPMPLGILAGIATGALTGWMLSLPALKAQDKYVALATLVTGLAFSILFVEADFITNGSTGITLEKRQLFGHLLGALDYAILGLILAGICMMVINRLAQRSIGRAFEAIRDSEVAADCMGVSPGRHKQIAFILSGLFCGLAGALFAYSQGYIAPNTFGFDTSVTFLLACMLGGKKTRSGALLGAATVIYLPVALNSISTFQMISGICTGVVAVLAVRKAFTQRDYSLVTPAVALALVFSASFLVHSMVDWKQIIYGFLILGVTYYLPNGLAGALPKKHHEVHAQSDHHALSQIIPDRSNPAIELDNVGMDFDGFVALKDINAQVMPGEIVGVIGPNGAGKSTLMNVITGVYKPTTGIVRISGVDNAKLRSADISNLGVARTFQNLQIFGGLTAIENVMVGLHKEHETNILKIGLGLGIDKDRSAASHAQALIEFVGLGERANMLASELSYGEQRYMEIARALATNPKVLLLDEPAAGLRGADMDHLKKLIQHISDAGIAVMVIEHHMDVIAELSDRVLAINFGQPMAPIGSPAEVLANPNLMEAYLGSKIDNATATPHRLETSKKPIGKPMLIIEGLIGGYNASEILHGVSLHVDEGEVVSILGSNGAGKTTTLKAVSGMLDSAVGRIEFLGHNLLSLRKNERSKLGLAHVPEGRRVIATLTVEDNLELGGWCQVKLDKAQIEEIFEMFPRLKDRRKQYAGTLSGGEQQMLVIGRALMSKPKMLLLDEPSMGLAPNLTEEVFATIEKLKDQDMTILIVEQFADKALGMSDRAVVLQRGEVAVEGDAVELRGNESIQKAYLS